MIKLPCCNLKIRLLGKINCAFDDISPEIMVIRLKLDVFTVTFLNNYYEG